MFEKLKREWESDRNRESAIPYLTRLLNTGNEEEAFELLSEYHEEIIDNDISFGELSFLKEISMLHTDIDPVICGPHSLKEFAKDFYNKYQKLFFGKLMGSMMREINGSEPASHPHIGDVWTSQGTFLDTHVFLECSPSAIDLWMSFGELVEIGHWHNHGYNGTVYGLIKYVYIRSSLIRGHTGFLHPDWDSVVHIKRTPTIADSSDELCNWHASGGKEILQLLYNRAHEPLERHQGLPLVELPPFLR